MASNFDLRRVLLRWAVRVCVVCGLAFAYQAWTPEPHPWLWQLVGFYAVTMLVILLGAWKFSQRKANK